MIIDVVVVVVAVAVDAAVSSFFALAMGGWMDRWNQVTLLVLCVPTSYGRAFREDDDRHFLFMG